jgi:hypothetical protein
MVVSELAAVNGIVVVIQATLLNRMALVASTVDPFSRSTARSSNSDPCWITY